MPQLVFSKEQEKKIREIVFDVLYSDYSPEVSKIFLGIERNLGQKIDNVEATQKFVIENQNGIKDLIKANYDLILRNNNAIKDNYTLIRDGFKDSKEQFNNLNQKLDTIIKKI